LSGGVQRVKVTVTIPQIQTNRHLRWDCRTKFAILSHGQSPYSLGSQAREFYWRPYRYSARLAFSYHLPDNLRGSGMMVGSSEDQLWPDGQRRPRLSQGFMGVVSS